MPEFRNIQRLNISQRKINTVTINNTGEWLAFGVSQYGQVLVWEWQSERCTYTIDVDCCVVTDFGVADILKQQGHYFDMNTLAYSPEGQYIATGGQDAKLKVWNASTGFCFVTFKGNVDRAII
jgi:periodic tryptophan protein 2